MWREYSRSYIKNNRSSGGSVMAAAFMAALFLSLLLGVFYNLWKYDVERIEREEGGWHSRIAGTFDEEDIETIRRFANVEDVAVNETESEGQKIVLDLTFSDMGTTLEDTSRIAEQLGVSAEQITYHHALLALYLVRDPLDTAPRLTFPFFILVTVLASFSLIVIIHNAFAVSMNARIRQFGIFSSIGATPRQIRSCLLQEAAALCAVPVFAGILVGIAGSFAMMEMMNALGEGIEGRHEAVFGYHPLVLAAALAVTVVTIWISAWLPAAKLSRLTPLEAIRNTGELTLKRRKHSRILTLLFGVEGELAGNALKAQKKALRTSSLSLLFAILAFTLMQCFFTLASISTRETYFERYQDAWDVMVTVKDTDADTFSGTAEVQALPGVRSAVVYQKALAKRFFTENELSGEMLANGGFSRAAAGEVVPAEGGWLVNAPIVILDDESFLDYCVQAGAEARLDGAIVLNLIRDVTNPDFRHPEYMPYVKEDQSVTALRSPAAEVEIPVLAYTTEVPVLREEYATEDHYELVHFMPVSLWRQIKGQIGGAEADTYIRVLGREDITLEECSALQEEIAELMGEEYVTESENRIREYETNDEQIRGMMIVLGVFCVLLAIIGVSNVFSNTLGFVRQRKREIARYLSVGMTPAQIRKMFVIEALVIAGRPILITLPLTVIAVALMLRASYLEAEVFLAEAPLLPIAVFLLAIFGSVALAYVLGWRGVRGIRLAEALRDDTMM